MVMFPTELARDAALLRFAAHYGEVRLSGARWAGCVVRRGAIVSREGATIGTLAVTRDGFVLSPAKKGEVEHLSAVGYGPQTVLEHPTLDADEWARRVAAHGLGKRPTVSEPSSGRAGGLRLAVGGVVALVITVAVLVALSDRNDSAQTSPEATEATEAAAGPAGSGPGPAGSGPGTAGSGTGTVVAPKAVRDSTESDGLTAAEGGSLESETRGAAPVTGGSQPAGQSSAVRAKANAASTGSSPRDAAPSTPAKLDTAVPVGGAPAKDAASLDTASSVATAAAMAAKPAVSASSSATGSSATGSSATGSSATGSSATGSSATGSSAARSPSNSHRSARAAKAAGAYTVEVGDTLSSIAWERGVRGQVELSGYIEGCMRLSGISDGNRIEPGQSLSLPAAAPPPEWVGDLYTAEGYPGLMQP